MVMNVYRLFVANRDCMVAFDFEKLIVSRHLVNSFIAAAVSSCALVAKALLFTKIVKDGFRPLIGYLAFNSSAERAYSRGVLPRLPQLPIVSHISNLQSGREIWFSCMLRPISLTPMTENPLPFLSGVVPAPMRLNPFSFPKRA